jgi:hypothetical protein
MFSERTDVVTRKGFGWLDPCLWEWTRRIERYAKAWPDDAAYWYSERASTSTLVASLAAVGADVLAEYDCQRGEPDESGRRRRGRTDFWCRVGRHEAVVEAKQVWPRTADDFASTCWGAFRRAREQLISAAGDAGPRAHLVSAVFAVPRLPYGTDSDAWKLFTQATEALVDGKRSDDALAAAAWAWCFPETANSLRGARNPDLVFPGVVVILREEQGLGAA